MTNSQIIAGWKVNDINVVMNVKRAELYQVLQSERKYSKEFLDAQNWTQLCNLMNNVCNVPFNTEELGF